MKINIQENPDTVETEIIIQCKQADAEIFRMLALLRTFDKKLTGIKDGKIFVLDMADALYFDTVDKKTFLYTENAVYETALRLYELEAQLGGSGFFRASKSMVLNVAKIASLRPELAGKIEVALQNGEKLIVSRQYAQDLKKILGITA